MSKPNQLNSSPIFVRFAGKSEKAKLRTEVYQGRDHVVLPIVALVGEIVVTGMNSAGPEYVPAHVLAAAPSGWCGRPIVNTHPVDADGNGGFANTPELWEQMCFGQAFHAEFSDNRLRVDCYLDPKKAEQVGEGAVEVLAKAEAGEMVEVSVGAWVWLEDEEGTSPSGENYSQRWAALVPDHIAVGLQAQGGEGACSVEMGCGGPRYYTAKQATAIRNLAIIDKELPVKPTFMSALLKNVNVEALASDLGMSTNELAMKLSRSLRAAVPGFLYVADIFPDSNTLIYIAMPKDEYEYYRCKYDATGDEATTSLHKRVEPSLTYKPIANTTTEGNGNDDEEVVIASNGTQAPCPCQHHKQAATAAAKETNMKKVKELAGKLVACAAAPFTAEDTAKLEAMSEAQLESLVKVYSEPQPSPTPEPSPAPAPEPQPEPKPAPETVTLTKEQHQHLTQLALREATREKKHRSLLIAALVADESVKAIYGGEKELGERSTDELEKLAQLVGVDDGSDATADMRASAGVLTPSGNEPEYKPLNSWGIKGPTADQLGVKPAASN